MHKAWLPAIALAAIMGVPQSTVSQVVLFSEDFQGTLAQWTGKSNGAHSGVIVADPLDPSNRVVTFSEATAFGDIFSVEFPVSNGELLTLSFDYLGLPVAGTIPGSHGGFVGYADETAVPIVGRWLVGTDPISGADPILVDDGVWHTYTVTFDPYAFFTPSDDRILLIVEDHISPVFDVFFDNFRVETNGVVSTEESTWGVIKGHFRDHE